MAEAMGSPVAFSCNYFKKLNGCQGNIIGSHEVGQQERAKKMKPSCGRRKSGKSGLVFRHASLQSGWLQFLPSLEKICFFFQSFMVLFKLSEDGFCLSA